MKKLYKGKHPTMYTAQFAPEQALEGSDLETWKAEQKARDEFAFSDHILEPTPDKITGRGMARTFQNIRLWKTQTVFDNVLIAKHMRRSSGFFSATFHGNRKEEAKQREEVLDLLRMYALYAERRGWNMELVYENTTELGGVKEASATIEGQGAWSRLKFEAGTHRVQRVPETESSGRIQTSAATVAVMPEAEEVEFTIDPKDLQIDTFRSSGAGGQHVNKTESAIRITHLPTGTVVECQDERSQYKNKDRAMKILRSKLYEAQQEKQNAAIAAQRKSQVGTGDRSGKIRTYNFPQNRVTDHRLTGDVKNFNIAAVINGDLDPLVDALTLADQARRLQEGAEKGE